MRETANQGMVLQLQGFSVNDGEGVRTVVFLAGCPLRCRWCANPETWDTSPKLAVYDVKCVRCGRCKSACPKAAFPPELNSRDCCAGCAPFGACASACANGALAVLCQSMTVDEVVRKAERDEIFYRYSGGGVTFSGGEPTVQAGFLRAVANRLHQRGVSMWMESCGYFDWERVDDILALMEHVFYDIKFMGEELHRRFTGVGNAVILQNCVRLYKMGIPMTIRIPAVKGINFTEENLEKTARFMRDNLPQAGIELLPYHNLGREKYAALGMVSLISEFEAPGADEISAAYRLFREYGIEAVEYR